MDVTLPLERMTIAEKLAVMELLWADLSKEDTKLESPAWHHEVLRERDAAMEERREAAIEWESAKQRLRDLRA